MGCLVEKNCIIGLCCEMQLYPQSKVVTKQSLPNARFLLQLRRLPFYKKKVLDFWQLNHLGWDNFQNFRLHTIITPSLLQQQQTCFCCALILSQCHLLLRTLTPHLRPTHHLLKTPTAKGNSSLWTPRIPASSTSRSRAPILPTTGGPQPKPLAHQQLLPSPAFHYLKPRSMTKAVFVY